MDEQPIIEIDTQALQDNVAKIIDEKFKELQERLAPSEVTESLTESLEVGGERDYDYRIGISTMLKSLRTKMSDVVDWHQPRIKVDDHFKLKEADQKGSTWTMTESMELNEAVGTVDPDCAVPELWALDVERTSVYPKSTFLGAWFMRWATDLQGKPGDTLHFSTVGPADCVDLTCDEPATTAATVTCPSLTLEHDVCAYTICREDIEDVVPDLITEMNAGLGDCLAKCVDNYFFNVALSCTNAGTLSCTTKMTGSMIAEAIGSMRNGTYEPVVLLTHPVPMSSLMQDTNFVYASRYGNRDVITGGRVVQWLSLEIHMVPKGTLHIGGGTYRSLLLAKGALAGALKHGVTIESEYSVRYQKRWVYADIRYGGVCLHPYGIFWITSVDGNGSC